MSRGRNTSKNNVINFVVTWETMNCTKEFNKSLASLSTRSPHCHSVHSFKTYQMQIPNIS